MPVLITVGLFLLFCFLWGVGSLFGSTKDAAQRWSGRRNTPSRAQKSTAAGIEQSCGAGLASTAQPAPVQAAQATPLSTALAQLREASVLRQSGAITQQEFEILKRQIMQGIKPGQ